MAAMEVDELFDAWERAWSGRDPRGFESICDPDVHYEDPLTPSRWSGRAALAKHARQLWKAMPDARVNSTGARLSDGTFACAPCRLLGTHTGRSAASTRPAAGRGARRRLRGARGRPLLARARVLRRLRRRDDLGVLPKPGTAGERAMLMLRGFGLRG